MPNVTPAAPTLEAQQAQFDANFARQLSLNMQTENQTAMTNMEKTRHDAMMAVISNFKN